MVLIHRWSLYAGSIAWELYTWGPVKYGLYKTVGLYIQVVFRAGFTVYVTHYFHSESYRPDHPVVVFGLLPHEQKMSVVHFLLKRHMTSSDPIKSKERMVFHVGYRRFSACPIYSQHTNADKHKVLIM